MTAQQLNVSTADIYRDWSADRWAGERIPALCDWPTCTTPIDRGLAHRCSTHGDDAGCDLFFCATHKILTTVHALIRPKPDLGSWERDALTDGAWEQWRQDHPAEAEQLRRRHEHAALQAAINDLARSADQRAARAAHLARVRESAALFRLADELRTASVALELTMPREAALQLVDGARVIIAKARLHHDAAERDS